MTILYLYYNQPEAIRFFEEIGYPDYDVDFLFVDDGSEIPLQLDWPNARVVRIEEEIPWNIEGATNEGFRHVTGKVFRSDIDHWMTPDVLEEMKRMKVGKGEVIHFRRQIPYVKDLKVVHNIYMINTEDFWAAGGYDEQFAGNYGYGDTDQKYRFRDMGYKITVSELVLNVNMDHMTKRLSRDMTINSAKFKKKWGM